MQTLHRFRKLVALVALIWLPMTVFAQVCATQCLLMSMQTHGAFSHSVGVQSATLANAFDTSVSGDAGPRFISAESDEHDCDMKAVCAFAALIPLTSGQPDLAVSVTGPTAPTTDIVFASYRSIADTPPPRTSL